MLWNTGCSGISTNNSLLTTSFCTPRSKSKCSKNGSLAAANETCWNFRAKYVFFRIKGHDTHSKTLKHSWFLQSGIAYLRLTAWPTVKDLNHGTWNLKWSTSEVANPCRHFPALMPDYEVFATKTPSISAPLGAAQWLSPARTSSQIYAHSHGNQYPFMSAMVNCSQASKCTVHPMEDGGDKPFMPFNPALEATQLIERMTVFHQSQSQSPSLQGSLIAIELIIRHCLPKFVRWGDGTYENSTQTIQTWKFLMSCDNACLMLHTCKLQVFDNVLEFIYVLVESWELGIDLPPQSNCTRLLLQFHLGHSFGEAWHANRMLLTGSRSLDTSYDLSWVTQSNPSLQPNLCQCSTFVTFVGVHLKIWNRNPEAQAICSSLRPHTWTVEGIAWLLSKPCKAH